jgi:HlyD family secretion protein
VRDEVLQVTTLKLADGAGMDQKIKRHPWHWVKWPIGARVGVGAGLALGLVLLAVAIFSGNAERSVRMARNTLTIAPVTEGIFHDFIPLRGKVVPHDTIYIDAIDGGRVERVLAQAGDDVREGEPLIGFSNTNLQLQVIQQEAQLNQATAQLQQNEINLELNKINNERALAQLDYNITRLTRSINRRAVLFSKGAESEEARDIVQDELSYDLKLKPLQGASNERQDAIRQSQVPLIEAQLKQLQENLRIVHAKLDNLTVRAPVSGRLTDMDIKVGENRNPGQRLAEITPDTGIKLSADVDEYYLSRIRNGEASDVHIGDTTWRLHVIRVYPQVKDGQFVIDLAFDGPNPQGLVPGQAVQGKLSLGGDDRALILPAGPFLEQTGGDWIFVLTPGEHSAERRRIKIGRRNLEQVEVLSGLKEGDRVITSEYTGLDRINRIDLQ